VSTVYDISQTATTSSLRDPRERAGGCYEIAVADGARVCVRALEPADRDALESVFERMSERSRAQRFLGPKRQLTDRDLTRLSNIDHVRHEALVAIDPADGSIVGVARYCKWPGRDGVAELAGEVVDDWQRRGIGGELLARIIERARANDIHKLTASAFSDNATALALLRRTGFTTTRRGYGVNELQLELVPPNRRRWACLDPDIEEAADPVGAVHVTLLRAR
jgi:RimJ/RimL family protein N-acetyltransferase